MDRFKHRFSTAIFITVVASLYTLVAGCTLIKVVPIQLARISQMESYTQTFDIDIETADDSTISDNKKHRLRVAELDSVLIDLLGTNNWQHLKDLYGSAQLVNDFLDKKIVMKGHMINTFYLDPVKEHERVLIEGFGRFFIIHRETGDILLSGDARIIPDYYPLTDFEEGLIKLKLMFYITRIPKRNTSYHKTNIVYNIKFNNKFKEQKVYAIDYSATHEMLLHRPLNNSNNKLQRISSLYFDSRYAGAKLIDFNGLAVIKNNYDDMVREFEKPREAGSQGEQYE